MKRAMGSSSETATPSLDLSLGFRPTFAMAESSCIHARVPRMPPNDPPNLRRDLIFLVLQFLDDEKFSQTAHMLEKESGVYFNMKHFEDTVLVGNWEEAEKYMSGFINTTESTHSSMIFFHLRWHKYFESIIRGEKVKALDILNDELVVFQQNYPQLYKEMAQYLTIPNNLDKSSIFIESQVKSLRAAAVSEINNVIISHPLLHDKLDFPMFSRGRLRTLLNQSLDAQELLGHGCKKK